LTLRATGVVDSRPSSIEAAIRGDVQCTVAHAGAAIQLAQPCRFVVASDDPTLPGFDCYQHERTLNAL